MEEMQYVVTAEILDNEPDGIHHEDGSRVWKIFTTRET